MSDGFGNGKDVWYYVAYDKARVGDYTSRLHPTYAEAQRELAAGLEATPEAYEGATIGSLPGPTARLVARDGAVDSRQLPKNVIPAGNAKFTTVGAEDVPDVPTIPPVPEVADPVRALGVVWALAQNAAQSADSRVARTGKDMVAAIEAAAQGR